RISGVRVAREFRVRQARAEIGELVGANGEWCEEIVRAGSADDVVLVDAVTADTDGADQLAVAIERKAAGENCDAVRETRVESGSIENKIRKSSAIESGKLFLQSEVGTGILHIEPRRIFSLGKEANRARGEGERIVREADGGPSFLHGDIPTEQSGFTGAKRAEHCRRHVWIVRIVFDGDENLHRNSDRQSNTGTRGPRSVRREINDAGDFGRGQARPAV